MQKYQTPKTTQNDETVVLQDNTSMSSVIGAGAEVNERVAYEETWAGIKIISNSNEELQKLVAGLSAIPSEQLHSLSVKHNFQEQLRLIGNNANIKGEIQIHHHAVGLEIHLITDDAQSSLKITLDKQFEYIRLIIQELAEQSVTKKLNDYLDKCNQLFLSPWLRFSISRLDLFLNDKKSIDAKEEIAQEIENLISLNSQLQDTKLDTKQLFSLHKISLKLTTSKFLNSAYLKFEKKDLDGSFKDVECALVQISEYVQFVKKKQIESDNENDSKMVAIILNMRGLIHRSKEQFIESLRDYSLALKFFQKDKYILSNRGFLLSAVFNCNEKAIEDHKDAVQIDGKDPKTLYGLGYVYHRKSLQIEDVKSKCELLDHSIDCYMQSITLDENNYAFYGYMALSHIERGKIEGNENNVYFENALNAFKTSLGLRPQSENFAFFLGYLYAYLGLFKEAVASFSNIRQIFTTDDLKYQFFTHCIEAAKSSNKSKFVLDQTQINTDIKKYLNEIEADDSKPIPFRIDLSLFSHHEQQDINELLEDITLEKLTKDRIIIELYNFLNANNPTPIVNSIKVQLQVEDPPLSQKKIKKQFAIKIAKFIQQYCNLLKHITVDYSKYIHKETIGNCKHKVTDLVYTSNGNVICIENNEIQKWEPKQKKICNTIGTHNQPILSIFYMELKNLLFTGDQNGNIKIWDLKNDIQVDEFNLSNSTESIKAIIGISSDTILFLQCENQITLWNQTTKTQETTVINILDREVKLKIACVVEHNYVLLSAEVSKEKGLIQYNVNTKEISFTPEKKVITCLCTIERNLFASGHWTGEIIIWEVLNQQIKIKNTLYYIAEEITAIKYLEKNILVSTSFGGKILLWDINAKKPINIIQSKIGIITSICSSRVGMFTIGATNGEIETLLFYASLNQMNKMMDQWKNKFILSTTNEAILIKCDIDIDIETWLEYLQRVFDIDVNKIANNFHVLKCVYKNNNFWLLLRFFLLLNPNKVSLDYLPQTTQDKDLLQVLTNKITIDILDVRHCPQITLNGLQRLIQKFIHPRKIILPYYLSHENTVLFENRSDMINVLAVNKDTIIAGTHNRKLIKLNNFLSEHIIRKKKLLHGNAISSLCFLNNEVFVSGSWDQSVKIWKVNNLKTCISTLHVNFTDGIRSIISLTTKIIAILSWNDTIEIWDIDKINKPILMIDKELVLNSTHTILYSTKNLILAIGNKKELKLICVDLENYKLTIRFNINAQDISSDIFTWCQLTYNDYYVSGFLDGKIRIWDSITRQELFVLDGHYATAITALTCLETKYLASGSQNGEIKIWDIENKSCIDKFDNHDAGISSLVYSEEYKVLLSGSKDGFIKRWPLKFFSYDVAKEVTIDIDCIQKFLDESSIYEMDEILILQPNTFLSPSDVDNFKKNISLLVGLDSKLTSYDDKKNRIKFSKVPTATRNVLIQLLNHFEIHTKRNSHQYRSHTPDISSSLKQIDRMMMPLPAPSDPFKQTVAQAVGEGDSAQFKFILTRKNVSEIRIQPEALNDNMAKGQINNSLGQLEQQLKKDLEGNSIKVEAKQKNGILGIRGKQAEVDRAAQLLRECGGKFLEGSTERMRHTGFFRWEDRRTDTSSKEAPAPLTCPIQ